MFTIIVIALCVVFGGMIMYVDGKGAEAEAKMNKEWN